MNRLTDLLASFCMALLLHGGLVMGAVWFWTLRPPEIRPMFKGGDVSLAVTFVASAADGGQTTDARQRTPEERRARVDDGQTPADIDARKQGTTGILTAPATEMPEDGWQTTRDAWQATDLSRVARDDGQQSKDSAAAPLSDALRQGVSGAVRRKSEIRPYYPLGARLRGEEGVVTVRVWVNGFGRARRCEVASSSGYPALDRAAVDAARRARYVSTCPGAWRTEVETALTFRFKLTE